MPYHRGCGLVIVASLLTFTLIGCAQKQQPPGPQVQALHIHGNEFVSDRKIKSKIVTEATGWWPFAKKKYFDPVSWRKDKDRIKRLYETHGFYKVDVGVSDVRPTAEQRTKQKIALDATVVEGPRFTLQTLTIEGIDGLAPQVQKALQVDLPLVVGKPFTEAAWAEAKEQLVHRLRNAGYGEADVQGLARVDLDKNAVHIALRVDPGEAYTFAAPVVIPESSPRVDPEFIRQQVVLAAPVGATYTEDDVTEAANRVRAMGVFSRADVHPDFEHASQGAVPLRVETDTAPFHTLRLGGGAGFDQVRNEVRLIGDWSDRNFFGGLRSLRIQSKVGWAFLPDVLTNVRGDSSLTVRSGPIASVRTEFEHPRFLGKPSLKLTVRAEGERQLQEAYTATTGRSGPEVQWAIRSNLRLSVGYTLDGSYLETLSAIDPISAPIVLGCDEPQCLRWLSFVSQRLVYDRRDSPLEPKRGFFGDLEFQEGGGPLRGDFTYLRALLDLRVYETWDNFTLSARFSAGSLWNPSNNPDETPISQRLFAGGGTSMRGFGYRRFSPLLPVFQDPLSDEAAFVPIGGNGLILGSLEARYGITETIGVATFYDAANVTHKSLTVEGIGAFQHALGIGLRWKTPVGLFRFDVARRLPGGVVREVIGVNATRVGTLSEDNRCFGIGGGGGGTLPDGACQIHLSIGEAF